jgi:hypothetical protein
MLTGSVAIRPMVPSGTAPNGSWHTDAGVEIARVVDKPVPPGAEPTLEPLERAVARDEQAAGAGSSAERLPTGPA